MKVLTLAVFLAVGSHAADAPPSLHGRAAIPQFILVGLSCSPRRTCSRTVESCEEAYWLMENCSWGGKLDGDHDGVPCENMCPGG